MNLEQCLPCPLEKQKCSSMVETIHQVPSRTAALQQDCWSRWIVAVRLVRASLRLPIYVETFSEMVLKSFELVVGGIAFLSKLSLQQR